MNSARLPGKAMELIAGRPMLAHVLERAAAIDGVDQVILATATGHHNLPLRDLAYGMGIASYIGSETDVLGRVYRAALLLRADVVIRVTGDCPLLDPVGSAKVLLYFQSAAWDYVSNVGPGTDGLDTEVMTLRVLHRACMQATSAEDREHVTPWIRRQRSLAIGKFVAGVTDGGAKWSVDSEEDLGRVRLAVRGRTAA